MRKLVIGEFISLDGVIQAPGGVDEDRDGGFEQGAWTLPYWHDDIGLYFMETMKDCDSFLLGRRTWQTHGEAFEALPSGDPFGDIMNGMRGRDLCLLEQRSFPTGVDLLRYGRRSEESG